MSRTPLLIALSTGALFLQASAGAQPISVRDTFPIGSGGSTVCSAQSLAANDVLVDMFDRGYAITCRDAAVPVGQLYAIRGSDAPARLAAVRQQSVRCDPAKQGSIEGLDKVETIDCTLHDEDVRYRAYLLRKGNVLYAAEGLAGYDSALQLGLRTLIADKPIEGELSVATTGAGDPAAFARVQAGTLDRSRALAEAYKRNNEGSYAESAEFFSIVSGDESAGDKAEGLVNEALQKSNLGRYAEADALFARANDLAGNDPVLVRQLRNYRAMHLLNQGDPKAAVEELDKPLDPAAAAVDSSIKELVIDADTAKRLNADTAVSRRLGTGSASLLPEEKVQILNGQASQLRGTALRLLGDTKGAADALARAKQQLVAVRGGSLTSLVWMRAQILGEEAAIAESLGDSAGAERMYRESVALLESSYPGSAALLSTRGRLAGYLAGAGQTDAAIALFREIVKAQGTEGTATPGLARVLAPYVDVLLKRNDPQSLADLFETSQILVRPGVAQTQAILARELSGGSDEAARLFRQSVNLTRQLEQARVELARVSSVQEPSAADRLRITKLQASIEDRQKEQLATQAKLSEYPRFRAVSGTTLTLADLQQQLRPGEAYYKMSQVGDRLFAMLITHDRAKAFAIDATADELDGLVTSLRETISVVEQGQRKTYPFDVGLSYHLYSLLFAPVEADLPSIRHLVFEPDGAMLRLPPNLLVTDKASLDLYQQRAATSEDAAFDFTGIHWLGRDRNISTSVSARAFRDVRVAPHSAADHEYLGLGENAVPGATVQQAGTRGVDAECVLSLAAWQRPISPAELRIAQGILAANDPRQALVLTQDEFTDTAVKERSDLSDYRIIHFATHGIVTSPRLRCPAQPALMTSFGGTHSDGLLTFQEIFDLRLDADLVILSACDTAGTASAAATRAAGLASGGEVALDGLVRAFVGAGGRLVIASHWPVPDDFDATKRLISGLFTAPPGTSTAAALRQAQLTLMDDPDTSHPFYWSGFATIGDGSAPVRKPRIASR